MSTIPHSENADGPRLIPAPIVSQSVSIESPDDVNNLNSPIIVATREVVPNLGLEEEQEHFPIPNT